MSEPMLRRVTIERRANGKWELLRERDATGERFVVADLEEAFVAVRAAYRADGRPRPALSRARRTRRGPP